MPFLIISSQIRDDLCAVLYDEEKCKMSEDFLELHTGDQGVLPLLTTGLRRNDVEVKAIWAIVGNFDGIFMMHIHCPVPDREIQMQAGALGQL